LRIRAEQHLMSEMTAQLNDLKRGKTNRVAILKYKKKFIEYIKRALSEPKIMSEPVIKITYPLFPEGNKACFGVPLKQPTKIKMWMCLNSSNQLDHLIDYGYARCNSQNQIDIVNELNIIGAVHGNEHRKPCYILYDMRIIVSLSATNNVLVPKAGFEYILIHEKSCRLNCNGKCTQRCVDEVAHAKKIYTLQLQRHEPFIAYAKHCKRIEACNIENNDIVRTAHEVATKAAANAVRSKIVIDLTH
jgi:hypothetical protein